MDMAEALEHSQPGLLHRVLTALQANQLSTRTAQIYCHWITRFVLFHELRDPATMNASDVSGFMQYLATGIQVSRARLNQAQQAIDFLYTSVLERPIKHLPVPRKAPDAELLRIA